MRTYHREIKVSDLAKEQMEELDMIEEESIDSEYPEGFVIGPNGEIRPADPLVSTVWALQIGTGQREEQYVDGKKPPPKKRVRIV